MTKLIYQFQIYKDIYNEALKAHTHELFVSLYYLTHQARDNFFKNVNKYLIWQLNSRPP